MLIRLSMSTASVAHPLIVRCARSLFVHGAASLVKSALTTQKMCTVTYLSAADQRG